MRVTASVNNKFRDNMSFKLLTKLRSVFFQGKLAFERAQIRNFAKDKKKAKGEARKCLNKTCGEPKPRKKSVWNLFSAAAEQEKSEKPSKESCRKILGKCVPDPDLSEFGGQAYKTCGPAYIIQKDLLETPPAPTDPEDKILEKLEKHPALKEVEDPMPPFESVEQRLLKLCELGLHPSYKRYMSVPKADMDLSLPKHLYKSRSGPIADDEYPAHLKLNKDCLDRKNIFAEFKRSEPPRQVLAKMLEIRQNAKPTLERKTHPGAAKKEECNKGGKEKSK